MRKIKPLSFFHLLLFFILAILHCSFCIASEKQESPIYFLSGDPTPKGDLLFPSVLYKYNYNKDNFKLIRSVTPKGQGTYLIHSHYNERIITIELSNTSSYIILDMNQPLKEKSFDVDFNYQACSNIETQLLDVPDKGLFSTSLIGCGGSHRGNTEFTTELLATNLSTMKQLKVPFRYYKYIRTAGSSSIVPSGTGFYLRVMKDGELVIPHGKENIETAWRISMSGQFQENENLFAVVNDIDILVVIKPTEFAALNKKRLGMKEFYIFNKEANTWQTLEVQGNRTSCLGFGSWIAGTVTCDAFGKKSPGYANRRKEVANTGRPVDWRLDILEVYSPGILFLYNCQSKKYYEITTNQGDSEVLLVENNEVIYRVNDKIFKAPILADSIGKGILIAQGEFVPDIHWAFMGPSLKKDKNYRPGKAVLKNIKGKSMQ